MKYLMVLACAVIVTSTALAADHGPVFSYATPVNSEREFSFDTGIFGRYGSQGTQLSTIDSSKADTNDYNEYAWLQLFDGTVNAEGVQAAQQANMLSKNQSYAAIHTLACLYAAEGKTTEARQLLLQAMAVSQVAEPNSSIWYGFRSIYEQYGVKDAAIAAYSKVEKPEGRMDPVDTYVLAEARLRRYRLNRIRCKALNRTGTDSQSWRKAINRGIRAKCRQ